MRSRKLRRVVGGLVTLALVAAVVVVLWPRTDRLTQETFGRLQEGMSPAEVEAILGPPNSSFCGIQELLATDELSMIDTLVQSWGNWFRVSGIASKYEPEPDRLCWLGASGAIVVEFVRGKATSSEWVPRTPIAERVKRQWHQWFPNR